MSNDRGAAFAALFVGNQRSFGQFDPANGSMWAEKNVAYTGENVTAHLDGTRGLGLVPVLDDGTLRFSAIDIDCHKGKPEIDLVALEQKVRDLGLPLLVCRSKSGGAHLYLFTSEPIEAKTVRPVMAGWAKVLGFPGVEVFPKQSELNEEGGTRSFGNWINLPYFDAARSVRYCVSGGKPVDFDFFLQLANDSRVTRTKLLQLSMAEHAEAPPCFQSMLAEGIAAGEGVRNKGLFFAATYFKKAFPGDWKDRAYDFNNSVLSEPLPYAEARKTIASAARRDYNYRCDDSPCKELCQRQLCLTRKFGIVEREQTGGDDDEGGEGFIPLPPIGPLVKLNSEPVKWSLKVDGKELILTTDQLMDYRKFRMAVAEELMRLMPKRKNETWHKQLAELMSTARVEEVPDEASTPGLIRAKLQEYIKKANLNEKGDDLAKRADLLRGQPVVTLIGDPSGTVERMRVVAFRGQDFVDWLRKNRAEELRGANLWMALRKLGIKHERLRVSDKNVINVWQVDIGQQTETSLSPVTWRTDI